MSVRSYSLDDLERESGVSRRTIRFWISRDLLSGPDVAGRNASYGEKHLERIREIQQLQRSGLTLTEIAARGEPVRVAVPAAEVVPWWQIPVADGVQIWVRGDLAPWHQRAVRRAAAEFQQRLANLTEDSINDNGR